MNGQRIIGIDPGIRVTGWGVIEYTGNNLRFIASGHIKPRPELQLACRLATIHTRIKQLIDEWQPAQAAIEETFVNINPKATLILGQARGAALSCLALAGLPVGEYAPNSIKKAVVGSGHAHKTQVRAMIQVLMPGAKVNNSDVADALAVAVCHAHHCPPIKSEQK